MKITLYDVKYRENIIHGILYHPEGKGPFPLIIRLNGMPGLSPEDEKTRLASKMVEQGYALYAFDYVGVRKSTGTFEYHNCISNINTVITELSRHPLIDSSKIALLGQSFGGAMAVSQAVRDNRISCMILCSPVYDTEFVPKIPQFKTLTKIWERNKQIRFPKADISKIYFKQTELYNPKKLASFLNCPVKVIAGDKDELLPLNSFKELYYKIKPKIRRGLEIIKGADHNFTKTIDKLVKSSIEFFNGCWRVGG